MAVSKQIELPTGERIAVLYEDRSVLAIDKPEGWMLAPSTWRKTARDLQSALVSSIRSGAFWAKSRNLRYVRFVHRLDADTTGVLLLVKDPGALPPYSSLFESRGMEKVYLAVVRGAPPQQAWSCRLRLAPDSAEVGRVRVDEASGKDAETLFRIIDVRDTNALVEARPLTGRTHQIRVHLAQSGFPAVGDDLYGTPTGKKNESLALRAVSLAYRDPFTRRHVRIQAPFDSFVRKYGFT